MNKSWPNRESNAHRFMLNERYVQFRKNIAMPIIIGAVTASPFAYGRQNEYTHATVTRYEDIFSRFSRFVNDFAPANHMAATSELSQAVIPAPIWLTKRMETLQQLPPPTLQEVETSFRAAEEMRSKCEGSPNNCASGRSKPAT